MLNETIFGINKATIKKYAPKIKYKSFKESNELLIILNLLNTKNTIIISKLKRIDTYKLI
jgi:hypothetical protein